MQLFDRIAQLKNCLQSLVQFVENDYRANLSALAAPRFMLLVPQKPYIHADARENAQRIGSEANAKPVRVVA